MDKYNAYIEYINNNILPFIDYDLLQKSYDTEDKSYAKTVLYKLHEAVVKEYGSDKLVCNGDIQFAAVPGVIRSLGTGRLCVVLLHIDLYSSGEHCGTDFLTKYGVVSQEPIEDKEIIKFMNETYNGGYDYLYTPKIYGDIHIDINSLPKELTDFLKDFQNNTEVQADSIILEESEDDLEM